jgi:hypothetical protein
MVPAVVVASPKGAIPNAATTFFFAYPVLDAGVLPIQIPLLLSIHQFSYPHTVQNSGVSFSKFMYNFILHKCNAPRFNFSI